MPRPPSNGRVTSPFGPRPKPTPTSPAFHYGEDTVGVGDFAPVTGTVVFAGYFGAFGNIVGIREDAHPDVIWWTAHHASIAVSVGQRTVEGVTFTGPLGRTGNVTGPHAHEERRVGGRPTPGTGSATNPRQFYTAAAGATVQLLSEPEVRYSPMSDTRLIWAAHLSKPGANVYLRGQLGTGEVVDSQYTQAQANQAAQAIGAPTLVVQSDAELKALQVVLRSIPATGGGADVDEAKLAAELAPLLDTVSEAELLAALGKLRLSVG